MKTTVLAVIAIVSTAAAIVEGVMLIQLSQRQVPTVATTAPDEAASSTRVASTDGAGAATTKQPEDKSAADVRATAEAEAKSAGSKTAPSAPGNPTDGAKEGAKAGPAPETESAEAAPTKELSAEEKQAQEEAEQVRKLKEFMESAADQQIKQMLAQLKLTDAQRELAGPTIEKLRQSLRSLMTQPQQIGMNYGQRIKTLTEEARLRGDTEEQIAAMAKAEQKVMMTQIKEAVVDGMTEMGATVEELRPILDAQQATTLDGMHKELKQSQEMAIRMMDAMQDPPPAPPPAP